MTLQRTAQRRNVLGECWLALTSRAWFTCPGPGGRCLATPCCPGLSERRPIVATQEVMTVAELRAAAERIAQLLEAARSSVDEAKDEAERLLKICDGRERVEREYLPRFEIEVVACLKGLVSDLGGDDGDRLAATPDFDIDRTPIDARNLCDLIDLATTSREAVAA